MTETIFKKEDKDFMLSCTMREQYLKKELYYSFKLKQRLKGKRKWEDIKECKNAHYIETPMSDILLYLSVEEVLQVAVAEYNKYKPTKQTLF